MSGSGRNPWLGTCGVRWHARGRQLKIGCLLNGTLGRSRSFGLLLPCSEVT